MRTVTAPTLAAIAEPITRPGYFVQIQPARWLLRLSSFGDYTWNSLIWVGANLQVEGLTGDGETAQITIWDPISYHRTLALTGIRDGVVTIWAVYMPPASDPPPALADVNMVFFGVVDNFSIAHGQVILECARLNSAVLLAPRFRVEASTGFNFLAPPGTIIRWGSTEITLGTAT